MTNTKTPTPTAKNDMYEGFGARNKLNTHVEQTDNNEIILVLTKKSFTVDTPTLIIAIVITSVMSFIMWKNKKVKNEKQQKGSEG